VGDLDSKLRNSESVEEIVKWVDNQLKRNALFTDKQMDKTFLMWKKLNDRRTNK